MSGKGSRYVAITRQEFEQFLKSIRKPFSLKKGTKGIYVIQLSDNVGLAVNSTIGDEVRGLGKASIKLNFVSLHSEKFHKVIYGYKKIMARVVKKKYLQRSTNWRKTLKDAIDKCIVYYTVSSTWFEKIALPDGMQQQPQQQAVVDTQLLMRIESIPEWVSDHYLSSFHDQVSKGRALSQKQMAIIQRQEQFARTPRRQTQTPQTQTPQYPNAPEGMLVQPFMEQPDQNGRYEKNLNAMRDLYVALRNKGAEQENLEEIAEIGKSLRRKGSLSSSEIDIVQEICNEERVPYPSFYWIEKPNPKKLASTKVAGQWNRVQLGNSLSEIYYRGIPTGSISKVNNGFEAKLNVMGRDKSLGTFRTEDQAFKKIQKEK